MVSIWHLSFGTLTRRKLSAILLTSLLIVGGKVYANENAVLIQEMLTAVCGNFQTSGEGTDFAIKGDASVQLSGLLKKLTDAGIQGAAEFNSDNYVGVLRSEVGTQLNSVRECKERVWKDLSPLLISS